MQTEDILQEIGFSGNEAKIYLALLKNGPSLVSKVTKETKLNRTHIYDRLQKLLERGMVSYTIQAGKKYFIATSPKKLLKRMKEKERKLQQMLPELLHTEKKEKVIIEVYKGKEGLRTILQDCLKERKEVLILGFTGAVAKELSFFYLHFQRKRAKLGIKRKIIADNVMKNSPIVRGLLTKARFMPKEYQSPSGMWIYSNKTIIFLLEDEPHMIVIESKKIAQLYKNYFDLLWKIAAQ